MSYHMCTGSPFPAAYHSPLTEKCDYNNKITDIVFSAFSFLVYLVFGVLVVYETVNRKVQEHHNRSRSSSGHSPTSSTKRLQILVDNWPLLLRLIPKDSFSIVVVFTHCPQKRWLGQETWD